jgi:hypothetical protein
MASCSEGVIPIGSLIVVDSGKARVYDSGTDNIEDVIGVAYAVANTSGKAFNIGDGPVFYTSPKDMFLWNDKLTFETDEFGNPIMDENYVGFNPWASPELYTAVVYKGFGSVLKPYSALPSRWVVLEEKTDYSWTLIR